MDVTTGLPITDWMQYGLATTLVFVAVAALWRTARWGGGVLQGAIERMLAAHLALIERLERVFEKMGETTTAQAETLEHQAITLVRQTDTMTRQTELLGGVHEKLNQVAVTQHSHGAILDKIDRKLTREVAS